MSEKPVSTKPPIYALAYTNMVPVANQHGYALAIHGSLGRDADFVAIPWTPEAADPEVLVDALAASIGWFKVDDKGEPGLKPHGRLAYNIIDAASYGEHTRWIDLSVMPLQEKTWKGMWEMAHVAFKMFRDTIEELGPVGILKDEEQVIELMEESDLLVNAIQRIALENHTKETMRWRTLATILEKANDYDSIEWAKEQAKAVLAGRDPEPYPEGE